MKDFTSRIDQISQQLSVVKAVDINTVHAFWYARAELGCVL